MLKDTLLLSFFLIYFALNFQRFCWGLEAGTHGRDPRVECRR